MLARTLESGVPRRVSPDMGKEQDLVGDYLGMVGIV